VPFLRNYVLGSPGDWRMLATSANGQPAAVAYTRDQNGNYQAYGICVLTVTGQGIRQIRSFADPSLVTLFESWLDRHHPGRPRSRGVGGNAAPSHALI
jgi:RNA polymerase sigma-70 factor (ECF subfamily)